MKLILFIIFSLSACLLMAQDCREHLLMQKGAKLEYRILWPTKDSGICRPASRLLFEVMEVKDSVGSTWSTIIKKGKGVFDSTNQCERKIVLQCDGRNLHIPYDFYSYDTLFSRDLYPYGMKDEYGYVRAYTPLADSITYTIPLALGCTFSLSEGKKEVKQIGIPGYLPYGRCADVRSFTDTYNIKNFTLEGKEVVTNPAGAFTCYKIYVEGIRNDDSHTTKNWLYFNRDIGLIKLLDNRSYRGYTEIVSVRK